MAADKGKADSTGVPGHGGDGAEVAEDSTQVVEYAAAIDVAKGPGMVCTLSCSETRCRAVTRVFAAGSVAWLGSSRGAVVARLPLAEVPVRAGGCADPVRSVQGRRVAHAAPREPVGCQKSARPASCSDGQGQPLIRAENRTRLVTGRCPVLHAACVYSLIRPFRAGFRRICCVSMSVRVARGPSRSSSGTCCVMPW